MSMGRHSLIASHQTLSPVHAVCLDYRVRFGWPVQVDELTQQVVLLAGEALTAPGQPGARVVVVDMPAALGSQVSSVLWVRSIPAVVFAVQRLTYVLPYRHTRWCFLAVGDSSRRYDNLDSLPVSLLDVQVIRDTAVGLPLRRDERGVGLHGVAIENDAVPGHSWVQPLPSDHVQGWLLPRLTAVLAAVCDVARADHEVNL
jgi:hypothetical protein